MRKELNLFKILENKELQNKKFFPYALGTFFSL